MDALLSREESREATRVSASCCHRALGRGWKNAARTVGEHGADAGLGGRRARRQHLYSSARGEAAHRRPRAHFATLGLADASRGHRRARRSEPLLRRHERAHESRRPPHRRAHRCRSGTRHRGRVLVHDPRCGRLSHRHRLDEDGRPPSSRLAPARVLDPDSPPLRLRPCLPRGGNDHRPGRYPGRASVQARPEHRHDRHPVGGERAARVRPSEAEEARSPPGEDDSHARGAHRHREKRGGARARGHGLRPSPRVEPDLLDPGRGRPRRGERRKGFTRSPVHGNPDGAEGFS